MRYDVFRQYVGDLCVQRDTRADLYRVFPDEIRCYVQSYAGNTVTKSARSVTCVYETTMSELSYKVSAAGFVRTINVVITRYFYMDAIYL